MTMYERLDGLVKQFNERSEKDEELRNEIAHLKKTFLLDLGTEVYTIKLEDSKITEFKEEKTETPDVTVISTPEHLNALIDGELRPMRAYVTGKVKIKGKIQDLKFLKKFL
ncbi:MAG: SCP2 sterol-binding domain-containing protein [Candidatus Methanomethylophilaceae archaeon]|jgi:putative sterol carrier protein